MALNVAVLGAPGAGKGTQAVRLAREHGIPKISTGDILREAVQNDTPLGRLAKTTMEAGLLVSDDVVIGIVRERLERADVQNGFVLDGFPRTAAQAVALDHMLVGRDPLIVVNIVVPDKELIRRLQIRRICRDCGTGAEVPQGREQARCMKCGGELVTRSDDTEEVVRERLSVYYRATAPIVDHYRGRPTFRAVDGNQEPDVVAAAMRQAVDLLIGATRTVEGQA